MGLRPPERAALQLQMIAPSSALSHSASDLQLPELFISLQLKFGTGAHTPSERRTHKNLNEKGCSHIALHQTARF
jgi:hypothetical protein